MWRVFQRSQGLLLLILLLAAAGLARGQERAIGIRPLVQERPEQYGELTRQTYGVFIGVNSFNDGNLVELKSAVADAREMYQCFVNELKYLPPENARLLITKAQGKDQPTRNNILEAIKLAILKAGPKGCVIVQIATHGIEGHLLAEDSSLTVLEDTSVPIATVRAMLEGSACPRRMLFLDACREKVKKNSRDIAAGKSPDLAKIFSGARGFMVMESCDVGQVSYEMTDTNHGVFTYYLLEGLRGKADYDNDGLITFTRLSGWVKAKVETWSKSQPRPQTPLCSLNEASGDLPLAISIDYQRRQQEKAKADAQSKQEIVDAAKKLADLWAQGKLTPDLHKEAFNDLYSTNPKLVKLALDQANERIPPDYYRATKAGILNRPEPTSTPTSNPAPNPASTPAPAVVKVNNPPVVEAVSLLTPDPDSKSSIVFSVKARDPEGDAVKLLYALNGQGEKQARGDQITMTELRAGKRTLTVTAVDPRGLRSAPFVCEFSVLEAKAPGLEAQVHDPESASLEEAHALLLGVKRPVDQARAIRMLEQLAANDPTASLELAVYTFLGHHIPQDPDQAGRMAGKALEEVRRLAESGQPAALTALGDACYFGVGTGRDEPAAVACYERAAAAGDLLATRNLAVACLEGPGGAPADPEKSFLLCRQLAEAGVANGMFRLGVHLLQRPGDGMNDGEAIRWLSQAARLEEPGAMAALALAYLQGRGLPKNEASAQMWAQRAAETGDAVGMYLMGLIQEAKGERRRAAEWLGKAAAKFEAGARAGRSYDMYQLGMMYREGRGVEQDAARSRQWLLHAAGLGNPEAKAAAETAP